MKITITHDIKKKKLCPKMNKRTESNNLDWKTVIKVVFLIFSETLFQSFGVMEDGFFFLTTGSCGRLPLLTEEFVTGYTASREQQDTLDLTLWSFKHHEQDFVANVELT